MHHRVIQAPTLEREWKAATGQQHPYVGLRALPHPRDITQPSCAPLVLMRISWGKHLMRRSNACTSGVLAPQVTRGMDPLLVRHKIGRAH